MDIAAFASLERTVRGAARAVGLSPEAVATAAPGTLTLGRSGVSVSWSSAGTDGLPGWVVSESYRTCGQDGSWRAVSRQVVAVPIAEHVRAAKCALLLVSERRLDASLAEAG